MNFAQYIAKETSKTARLTEVTMLDTGSNTETLEQVLSHADPKIMTGRTIRGVKYCIFNKKFINLTELANQVRALYASKGYLGVGFSKLDDTDYVRYSTAKVILDKLFNSDLYFVEIDPIQAAKYFLAAEYAEF